MCVCVVSLKIGMGGGRGEGVTWALSTVSRLRIGVCVCARLPCT